MTAASHGSTLVQRATPGRVALIACGGALGASARWGAGEAIVPTRGVPWALLMVNFVGAALLAWALAEVRRRPAQSRLLIDFVGTGFCGGLTTFSALAIQSAQLTREGRGVLGLGLLAGSVIGGIAVAASVTHLMPERDG